MKTICFLLLVSAIIMLVSGCGEEAERENPLDAQNQLTGGKLPGVKARAGDGQVILTWPNLGFEGIIEYRIYRAHRTPELFQQVTSIKALSVKESEEYEYIDKGLQNDADNRYYYRISYVDKDGREVPDPKKPQNLSSDWFLVSLIPSQAPPVPDVKVVADTDLQVRLIWEGYSKTAPKDLAGFKIFSILKAEKGEEQPLLALVDTIKDPKVEFYIDGNDYAKNKINFKRDGITKLYKVVAFDQVGVECDSPILEGTSPNLPPSPPAQVKGVLSLGINTYDVRLVWRANLEPDVEGYKVYALLPDGGTEFKGWIRDPNETAIVIEGERYVVVEGEFLVKQYYVTAYDNTKKLDENNLEKTDESKPAMAELSEI